MECLEESWSQIYDADILQFAALAFLFCALIRFLKMKPWQGLTAAVIIALIGMGLNNTITDLENPVLQAVTGLFWGTHEGSYFPFTSWIVFVAAGYFFADILQRTENKKPSASSVTCAQLISKKSHPIKGMALFNFRSFSFQIT
ncbi:MAG: DUF1624 domain-containing protein [Clostridiales bacterium]|nr:DUF1624 domain-containing protein [Candidatus Blautia equi]